MSGTAPVRFGVTTMATEPPERFRALVRAVEESGFDDLWVCDSSLHARDAYAFLTLVATESRRLRFGPNCAHPYTRHPALTLNAMATLHELSGGRARVAVGAGDRPVTELGYRTAPVAVVRGMLDVLRALQRGETVDIAGPAVVRHAQLTVPLPAPLPIYVSASGPRMLALGGEVADGVLFLPGVLPACVEFALERIRAGAATAGRDSGALDLGCTVAGSLRDAAEVARAECVPMAAWFPQTAPVYAKIAGVEPEIVAKIRAAYAGGHFDGARKAFGYVTDEMVDRFTVAGPAELWVRRLAEVIRCGVRHINIFLLSRDKLAMVRDLGARVLPRLKGA
ncbi:MAG: LLM class flavin-dependent oxidoreductase [Candidatus Rokubacteria bacterium]|nr:LLM class flavin-dependent oxidoreductase [Candidatus Rokubacteria bacterium]